MKNLWELEKSCRVGESPKKAHQTEFFLRVAVCAWCKPGKEGKDATTHGICPRHLREMMREIHGQAKRATTIISSAHRKKFYQTELLVAGTGA